MAKNKRIPWGTLDISVVKVKEKEVIYYPDSRQVSGADKEFGVVVCGYRISPSKIRPVPEEDRQGVRERILKGAGELRDYLTYFDFW